MPLRADAPPPATAQPISPLTVAHSLGIGHGTATPFQTETMDGARFGLSAALARGPVLLAFWATWCGPCRVELPQLDALQRKYAGRGLTTLAIATDGPRNRARVRPFAAGLGLDLPLAVDGDGSLQQSFQVRALPTTILIASDGKLAYTREGYVSGDAVRLERAIQSLLPAMPDSTTIDRPVRGRGSR